jgi:hypothetical protein
MRHSPRISWIVLGLSLIAPACSSSKADSSDHAGGAGNAQAGAGSAQAGAGNAQAGAGNAQAGAGSTQAGAGNTQGGAGNAQGEAGYTQGEAGNPVVPTPVTAEQRDLIVLAWNDLGMHCLNPTYEDAVILPPYNTLWAQVIERGDPPTIVTDGVEVTYRVVNNTSSADKTDDLGADFGQFWDNSEKLFGVALDKDTGLNLVDPTLHNGLSGSMVKVEDHFQVNGVPVVPVDDDGVWDPYQVAEITVRSTQGDRLASTRVTIPTSDEINCARCHAKGGKANEDIGGGTSNTLRNVLAMHDEKHGTELVAGRPKLCAECHGAPALGTQGKGAVGIYLSGAIHGSHASRGAVCYDCHPGDKTQCSRSEPHTADDGNCTACHGNMTAVASAVLSGDRVPWETEPKCADCHDDVAGVDTGGVLYRNSRGHGDVYCAACHGSPHAQVPSREATDNAQPKALQGKALPLGSCGVCHEKSRGEGAEDFGEEHAGKQGRPTACRVCHTVVYADTKDWPHSFQWKAH